MFDFSKLTSSTYLFDSQPPSDFASKKMLLIIFGLIILISLIEYVAVHFLVKNSPLIQKTKDKIFYLLLITGIGGLSLVGLRSAGAVYLSSRILFLAFVLGIIGWAVYIILYLSTSFPGEYQGEKDRQRRERYLPK